MAMVSQRACSGLLPLILQSGDKADVPASSVSAITGCEQVQRITHLFNHLVGPSEQHGRNCETDRPGGLEIDNQLEAGGLFDR